MDPDTITTVRSSTVQHGSTSDRVYLMRLAPRDLPWILDDLEELAAVRGYGKIFARIPASSRDPFLSRGYVVEARIPGLFQGVEDGYFISLFRDPERSRDDRLKDMARAGDPAHAGNGRPRPLPPEATCSRAEQEDAPALAALYREVFPTYPFPIDSEAFIRESMVKGVVYYGIRFSGTLVAASSAEVHGEEENAEMSDFATHPAFRGLGLSGHLLREMEGAMRTAGLKTVYTIARAASFPMNLTFARAGYDFGGVLLNNTGICDGLESMNVWYRSLQ